TGSADWFRGSIRGTAASDGFSATLGYTRTKEGDMRIRLLPGGGYDHSLDYRADDYVVRLDANRWFFQAGWGRSDSEWDYTNLWTGVQAKNVQEMDYRRFVLGYADGVNTVKTYHNVHEREILDDTGRTTYGDSAWGLSFNRRQRLFGLSAVWGLDLRREMADFKNLNNPWGDASPYDLTRDGLAPYVEFSVPLGEVAMDLGLRYEYWNVDQGDSVSEFIPRVSFNWESPTGKLWYLTAGRFFAMPSFYQIFMPSRSMGLPNPNLRPEQGWTYDLGVRDPASDTPWSLGLFYVDMDDKIDYSYDPVTWFGQYVNINRYRAWGAEGTITFHLGEHWSYTQGISWTKAEEKVGSGSRWGRSGTPRWDVSGRLNYANGPWNAELSVHYYGDRELKSAFYDDDDMIFVNASVAWMAERDTVRLSCTNIFDEEYVLDTQGYLAPERRFTISWEHTF
ncbi:MAG TPA: TonB-dependent receptor, partial [Synergistaceae bacterium]|nr:TonB-dependent receptor [Synergistaceae bacterium]